MFTYNCCRKNFNSSFSFVLVLLFRNCSTASFIFFKPQQFFIVTHLSGLFLAPQIWAASFFALPSPILLSCGIFSNTNWNLKENKYIFYISFSNFNRVTNMNSEAFFIFSHSKYTNNYFIYHSFFSRSQKFYEEEIQHQYILCAWYDSPNRYSVDFIIASDHASKRKNTLRKGGRSRTAWAIGERANAIFQVSCVADAGLFKVSSWGECAYV